MAREQEPGRPQSAQRLPATRRSPVRPGMPAGPPVTAQSGWDSGGRVRRLTALQRTVGNATTAATVQRQDASLTPQQLAQLRNAENLLTRASAGKKTATDALSRYASTAPRLLSQIEATFEGASNLYAQAAETVNYRIERTKALAAVRNEVLLFIIDKVTAGVVPRIEELISSMGASGEQLVRGLEGLKSVYGELTAPFDKGLTGVRADVADAAGLGEATAPGSGTPDWAEQSSFHQVFGRLQGQGSRLLPLALQAGQLGVPLGRLTQAATDAHAANRQLSYPIDQLERDAAVVEDAARQLSAAAPGVTKILDNLQAIARSMRAAAPRAVGEVENEIWVHWAAGLSPTSTDILDEDYLEEYLRKRGIWERLGIDIGGWFSDREESLAVVSAKAQTRVLEHKGSEFSVLARGNQAVTAAQVGDLPELPVILTSDGERVPDSGDASRVTAVVIGARTNTVLVTDLFNQAENTKSALADLVLRRRYISIVGRVVSVG